MGLRIYVKYKLVALHKKLNQKVIFCKKESCKKFNEVGFPLLSPYKARMIWTLIWAIMSSLLYLLSYSLVLFVFWFVLFFFYWFLLVETVEKSRCGQRNCTSILWSWAKYVTITSTRVYYKRYLDSPVRELHSYLPITKRVHYYYANQAN